MPYLRKISILNYRNIEFQELHFSSKINCISGGNGEGKTNLIDAIWYLSMTKSAISTSDRYNFRYGTDSFSLAGNYEMPSGTISKFSIQVSTSAEKRLKRDDKFYSRISDHIGVLPIVIVSPTDSSLIHDSGEERRKFVNSVLSQMDKDYLHNAQQYNRLLQQRNQLLKEEKGDEDLLSVFDEKLAAVAAIIHEKREQFCSSLIPLVRHYYSEISGGQEEVSISYKSDLSAGRLQDILKERRDRDRFMHYTTAGVHRDDFLFTMNEQAIRRCGSQGQQKSFLVALKFAQYEVMKSLCETEPMMLLDDLFDKLDPKRVSNLLSLVASREFGQIFLSDSDKTRTKNVVDAITSDRTYIETTNGSYKIVNE